MNDIEVDTEKWKYILCSQIGKINITKFPIFPKASYMINAIPTQISMAAFTEQKNKSWNTYGNTKDPKLAALIKNIEARDITWLQDTVWRDSNPHMILA